MKELTLSASQIDKVEGCVRAAAFHYVDRIRVPGFSEASKELGKRVHKICQDYVQEGKEPDDREMLMYPAKNPRTGITTHRPVFPGQIAAAAFPYLRKGPNTDGTWLSETKIDGLRLPSGIRLQGDIDLAAIAELMVIDFKTTSDFKYAPKPEELLTWVQPNLYGYAWFEAVKRGAIKAPLDAVNLHWIYLLTKGRARGHSVRAVLTKERNDREIARIDAVAKPWAKIRLNLISGYALPPTGLATGHCEKYLGCPYRGIQCRPTMDETLKYGVGRMQTMDLATLLAQHAQTQNIQQGFPAPAGAQAAVPPPSNPFASAPAPAITAASSGVQRPAFWIPGDAMNDMQEFAKSKGHPLSKIASLADNPPPADVGALYDTAPKVEAGTINPPQATGMIPASNPETAAALAGQHVGPTPAAATAPEGGKLDRAALKAKAIAMGLVDQSCSYGAARLAEMIAAEAGKGALPPAQPQVAASQGGFPTVVAMPASGPGPVVGTPAPSNPFASVPAREACPAPHTPETFAAQKAEHETRFGGPVTIDADRLRELERCETIVKALHVLVAEFRA